MIQTKVQQKIVSFLAQSEMPLESTEIHSHLLEVHPGYAREVKSELRKEFVRRKIEKEARRMLALHEMAFRTKFKKLVGGRMLEIGKSERKLKKRETQRRLGPSMTRL